MWLSATNGSEKDFAFITSTQAFWAFSLIYNLLLNSEVRSPKSYLKAMPRTSELNQRNLRNSLQFSVANKTTYNPLTIVFWKLSSAKHTVRSSKAADRHKYSMQQNEAACKTQHMVSAGFPAFSNSQPFMDYICTSKLHLLNRSVFITWQMTVCTYSRVGLLMSK